MHEAQLVAPAVVVAAVGEDVPDDERIDRVGRRCGSIRSRPVPARGQLRVAAPEHGGGRPELQASSRSRDSSAREIVAGPRPEIADAVAGSSGARPRASILHQLAGEKSGCRRWPRAAPRAPPARGRRRHAAAELADRLEAERLRRQALAVASGDELGERAAGGRRRARGDDQGDRQIPTRDATCARTCSDGLSALWEATDRRRADAGPA
jgi:hypothetical protein